MENKYNKDQALAIASIINEIYVEIYNNYEEVRSFMNDLCWYYISQQYDIFILSAINQMIIHNRRFDLLDVVDRKNFLIKILFDHNIDMLPLYAVGNNIVEDIEKMKLRHPHQELSFYIKLVHKFSEFRLSSGT